MQTFIRKGCGYDDVTVFPEGGDFHRAQNNLQIEVIRDLGNRFYAQTENGRKVVAQKSVCGDKPSFDID